MTPTAKDMADVALIAMKSAFPTASMHDRAMASFLLTSHFCKVIVEGSDEENAQHNKEVLEGMVMGLFAQLNPAPITH